MPSVKEKCVCQICICGKHHCGQEIKFPSLIEEPEQERKEEESTEQTQKVTKVGTTEPRDDPLIEQDTQSGRLESDGQHPHQQIVTITVKKRKQRKGRKSNKATESEEEEEEETNISDQSWTEMKSTGEPEGQQNGAKSSGDAANESESEAITIKTSQRKTWQTSPEQVEELTRSLSRMRTDHDHGGYLYEKMIEKEKSKTLTRGKEKTTTEKSKQTQPTSSYDQPHLVNGTGQANYSLPSRMTNRQQKEQTNGQKESFLPPLTGFSDSDSSFGSFSCSVDGDAHQHSHDRQIQCICESMKKTKLEKQDIPFQPDETTINYIDVDNNWIVSRPTRNKPRDNLRLEGPMDMETTFQSTYESTAQRMIERGDSEDSVKSKRSTATNSRVSKGSPHLYLNTRKGRTGATPLLRSAKKRRSTRNRPMTSLKAGGDGYYNTNNREAYKNFIIINGEAKMVSDHVKLPKVVTMTTLTSEEKNRQKYLTNKSAKMSKKNADSKTFNGDRDKMVMIGGEEIRKFEKKSYIAKSDGAQEMTDVERKIIRKVKVPQKEEHDNHEKKSEQLQNKSDETQNEDVKPTNRTMDTITGAPKRPFVTRYQDNIKELGLLDRTDETTGSTKDHETESPIPTERPIAKAQASAEVESKPQAKSKVINGHAVKTTSRKPFIIPQRIHRHKNECSVNVFEGNMDFVTTNRQVYGETTGRKPRIGSGQRKHTAGRRYLKSGKRRNLFRQSSDSMFSAPTETNDQSGTVAQTKSNPETAAIEQIDSVPQFTSTYQRQFDDRLYCPALDVTNSHTNDNFKFTGQAGGHKYYLSKNYS